MRELAVWHAPTLPGAAEAEARYLRILGDEAPVPLDGLDARLRAFVLRARERAPLAEVVAIGGDGGGPLYSTLGIAVRCAEESRRAVLPRLGSAAVRLGLLTYDRHRRSVFGTVPDPDLTARSS